MKKYSWRHQAISFDKQGRFTGHEFDTGTGLNYMDARHEGPTLSRFLSQDPNFIQGSPENWQNAESAEPQYAALNGFANTNNSVYLANPQNLNTPQTTGSVLRRWTMYEEGFARSGLSARVAGQEMHETGEPTYNRRLCRDPAMRWVVGDRAITGSATSAS
jgi:RHS repeat-associated protein